MLWDASFDQNHIINGKQYSEYIGNILNGGNGSGGGKYTTTTKPITGATTQKPITGKSSSSPSPLTTAPPTKPS